MVKSKIIVISEIIVKCGKKWVEFTRFRNTCCKLKAKYKWAETHTIKKNGYS
jgi:hypothetical protein